MTDQAPMQPGYRARAEAAEARVRELEAERDKYRVMVDEDFLAQLMGDDLNTVQGRATYAAVRGEAAEMEREHRRVLAARAADAEAREQALRDRVGELADEFFAEGINCVCGHDIGGEHNGRGCYAVVTYSPLVRCDCPLTDNQDRDEVVADRLRNLLSPPTAPGQSAWLGQGRQLMNRDEKNPTADTLTCVKCGKSPISTGLGRPWCQYCGAEQPPTADTDPAGDNKGNVHLHVSWAKLSSGEMENDPCSCPIGKDHHRSEGPTGR